MDSAEYTSNIPEHDSENVDDDTFERPDELQERGLASWKRFGEPEMPRLSGCEGGACFCFSETRATTKFKIHVIDRAPHGGLPQIIDVWVSCVIQVSWALF